MERNGVLPMEYKTGRLCDLPTGKSGIIIMLPEDKLLRKQLSALGLVTGSVISREFISPFNEPSAYFVRDCLLSIRNAYAEKILVRFI